MHAMSNHATYANSLVFDKESDLTRLWHFLVIMFFLKIYVHVLVDKLDCISPKFMAFEQEN